VGQLAQSLKGTLRNGADVVAVDVEELQSAHTLMTHAIQFNSGAKLTENVCRSNVDDIHKSRLRPPFLPGAGLGILSKEKCCASG
jgi:hypothetical protein